MLDATIVTFACNREEHLRQSMQSWLQTPHSIVVVDYSSDKPIQIDNDRVKVVRVEDRQKKWNRSHAVNVGAKHVETPLMFIIDADLPIADFGQFDNIGKREYFAVVHSIHYDSRFQDFEGGGSCLVWMDDYRKVNGLSEICEGWGWEDRDFYERLHGIKVVRRPFTADYIFHDEIDRVINTAYDNRWMSHCVNSYRCNAYQKHVDVVVGNYGKPIGGLQPVGYTRSDSCLPVYDADGNEINIVDFLNEHCSDLMRASYLRARGACDFWCICDMAKYNRDILRVINSLKREGRIHIGTVTGG